ncbi:hypothetical protein [Nocardia sp. NPDC049149]|uniref:hypothetical protein n=1 Tax=Nocardia sp. NPDC049149 TaxID=3364315 RepID=UPI00372107D3
MGFLLDWVRVCRRHEGAYAKHHDYGDESRSFYEYLVLSDDKRRAVQFVVNKPGHDYQLVSDFLGFVRPRVALAFDGRSHHKLRLQTPIGRFDHVLMCAPSLFYSRYDGRVGQVMPILDCEIGDGDTEAFVAVRLHGRDSMPSTTWDREPFPVIDLRFDLHSDVGFAELGRGKLLREKKFRVYRRSMLDRSVRLLAESTPDSQLEIRNYRGAIRVLRPADVTSSTGGEIDSFLLEGY